MESELAAVLKELVETIKIQNENQVQYQAKILVELHELNTTLRHMQSRASHNDI